MFRNQLPHYEILSADAMSVLDSGWRRFALSRYAGVGDRAASRAGGRVRPGAPAPST